MSSSKTDIWYLIGNLEVGGAERTLVDLANGLAPDQYRVSIWTITEPGPLATDVDEHVTVRSLEAKHKTDLRAPLRFISALRHKQPDILQSFLFYDNTLATLAGLLSPRTTVITGVRAVPNESSTFRRYIRHITCRLADHVVSNSEAGSDFILNYGVSPDKVSVVRNGRDIDKYRSGQSTPELRKSLGIPTNVPVVGTVGRLIERKGHYDLLEAWPAILDEHPEAHLLIVGEGPERDGLENLAKELRIADSVHLPGTQDNIPNLLDMMDVFVFPSHYEGLPGALLEAMCAELPIVTTPVDGCLELVEDGVHGTHVSVGDIEALAQAIVQYLADSALADEHAASAYGQALSSFSLEIMVENFEELYNCLTTP
ncbi:glycosyltransferase [Halorubrum ezzemoulense]|uniref:glycosyltransferase n=1 Tax=Halorubrum ezzemoulense TaxID=337243 RepID=UPI00232FB4A2|nr:glycosyltransferase [Halorubrum ezzemoulense]MDB2262454.1 glycosyltransferase [Halorubrum ezzemoulense]MDB2269229.1 glycosyltransferase [Halorubrum ezzemoulense]